MVKGVEATKNVAKLLKKLRKRDGEIVKFDIKRISNAVNKAMKASGEGDEFEAHRIAEKVVLHLYKSNIKNQHYVPTVEEVQDAVERELIWEDFADTAKAYILYREKRAQERAEKADVPEETKKLYKEASKYFRNQLAEFVYYRTYSRWIEDEGRRETWIETVDRYMDFMKENLGKKLSAKECNEIRAGILKQQSMPSMRLLQFAGKAARRTNVCAYNCSFIAPSKLQDFGEIMYVLMCGTGLGFTAESWNVQQLPQIKFQTGKKLKTYTIPDTKEGWADALVYGMKTWFAGKDVDFDFSKLRPAGAKLKIMGGRSSGPDPLRSVLSFAREKILAKQGRRLSNIDVHDIVCKIGEVVVAGGVRRSALISLSDLDDVEMRDAKKGQFYLTEPQRMMANNSAVYMEKPSNEHFMDEWVALMKSGSGERGIFNRGSLKKTLPERRLAQFKNKDYPHWGTNPCVVDSTWVMTADGPRQVKDIIGKTFVAMVDGKKYISSGFFETGYKQVFRVRTQRGFEFTATGNHKVLTVAYKSRKIQKNEWKEVKDLTKEDQIILHDHKDVSWDGNGTKKEGWLLGSLYGDGNIEKNGKKANLDYWGETKDEMMQYAVSLVKDTVETKSNLTGHISKQGVARVGSAGLAKLAETYGMTNTDKTPKKQIEESSSDFYEGFLQGWFDADGSVQGDTKKGVSIRLASSSLSSLQLAQRMLARLGVISTIYKNRRPEGVRELPNGKGGKQEYYCNADHELVISNSNIARFAERINFREPLKTLSLAKSLKSYVRKFNKESFSSKIVDIIPVGKETVYDCSVPNINAFDANGLYVHNCGEIILQSKSFCNLSEVVARAEDTEKTLMQKIRLATILGTYQSTLTNFGYLSDDWKKNCEKERLLGVSITGQWDCPVVRDPKVLEKLKKETIRVNKIYAKKFGVAESTCITAVKPSGTLSQVVDSSSGMHPRHAKYYIRRIRIAANDPLFKMVQEQGIPYQPEVGQSLENANTYVLEFPVEAPKGAIFKDDITALDQLEHWKIVKKHYTEHNPSVTISVSDDEWIGVANWVYENWDLVGGLSFLPRDNHVYQLAPYEAIDKKRYDELKKQIGEIDFSKIVLHEKEDATEVKRELACVSGTCEI